MRAEREQTMREIDALPWPDVVKADVPPLWAAIQQSINAHVQAADRVFDGRVLPTTLRLAADETERVHRRLTDAGLAQSE